MLPFLGGLVGPRWVLLVPGDSDGSLDVCSHSRYSVRRQSYLGGVVCVSRVLVLHGFVAYSVCGLAVE